MTTKTDVEFFLNDFHTKMKVFDIFFENRTKNFNTLKDLEISPSERISVIEKLKVIDYSEGPRKDNMADGPDMWIFGRVVEEEEIYIKITLGDFSSPVICISFHIAEHPMEYPFQ
ncbi:MAG: Motility quorum-sensing regulator, toxin of MqsA [uncultured Aureispira sp.]|uniref:Motility quorum-sensing regulator, toxin of MqsA n=1 Tax=uncultured Aureispira sp. TaxID=1331704 RepID=A0A6S6T5V9_9BACT|nr:MAG: Motility quorum-sensing regulator, toxin of MqsA [uncultured Aureispira sp.]